MNIFLLICDELRFDALGYNGNPYVKTPNIDRLAQKSVRFENCYCQAPICAPSRFSIATGQYPFNHGVINNDNMMPNPDTQTIGHVLKNMGYKSLKVGDGWNDKMKDSGFEANSVSIKLTADRLDEEKYKHLCWEREEITRRTTGGPSTRSQEEYEGYLATDLSLKLIREAADKNEKFFIWNSIIEPHPPYYPTKEIYEKIDQSLLPLPDEIPDSAPLPHKSVTKWREQWKHLTGVEKRQIKAGYYGLVEQADNNIGRILNLIDELELWDDSIIVFTADHGEQLGDHNIFNKMVLREQSVHVPLCIYHPNIKPGVRTQFVEHVDLLPTICDLIGMDIPEATDGISLKKLLESEVTPDGWREAVYSQISNNIMIRTSKWKLNLYDGVPGELYDLKDDPREHHNLISNNEYLGIIHELSAIINEKRQIRRLL